jgi:hypothetical protein
MREVDGIASESGQVGSPGLRVAAQGLDPIIQVIDGYEEHIGFFE